MLALVGLVAGALVAAGAGSLLIARHAARRQAQDALLQQAQVFARAAREVKAARVLAVVDGVLKLEGGEIVTIGTGGLILTPLPAGVSIGANQAQQLGTGRAITGWYGDTAFAAVPVATGLVSPRFSQRHFAVLLTRAGGNLGPSWLYFVFVTGLTLAGAALLALWLSRRITRPLVEATAVTGRVASGELTARVPTSGRDIPELVSLADSINSMAERLEGTRERERQMLLSVSHDLRTPLTSIRGYAEAIQDGVADGPQAAAVIVSESRRLERLVADLLDLARLEMSRLSLHIGPTDVAGVLASSVEGFLPDAGTRGVTLRTALPPGGELILAAADSDRLAQVVANLVENALAFASSAVTVGVAAAPAEVTITVDDDGAGIARADLSKVFERFYQADRGAARGSGLGLAIVAELVRAMGGTVGATSPTGPAGGTRMSVSLRRWTAP